MTKENISERTPSTKTIEYIIDYTELATTPGTVRSLKDSLADFTPTYIARVPYASIFVSSEQESSLLQTLASIPLITYRRGVSRRAFKNDTKEDSL